jgi:phospholipid/cholesterol/gamma-HCH transport system substrate-binding protein
VQAASQGITGVKYLQISPGSIERPLLMKGSRERPPVIPSRRGRLDEVVNDLGKLTANGAEALERVNRVLSDANIRGMSGTLDNVNQVTAEFNARKSMFANMDSTIRKLDGAAGQLQSLLASTRGALGNKDSGALAELSGASSELRGAATNMRMLVARLDGPVSEVSTTTVPELNATMNSIQQAAKRLDDLTLEIQRDPRALISSRSAKEVEIAP